MFLSRGERRTNTFKPVFEEKLTRMPESYFGNPSGEGRRGDLSAVESKGGDGEGGEKTETNVSFLIFWWLIKVRIPTVPCHKIRKKSLKTDFC